MTDVFIITAVFGIGVFIGLTIAMVSYQSRCDELNAKCFDYERYIKELESASENTETVQVIEINDNRPEPDSYFTPF